MKYLALLGFVAAAWALPQASSPSGCSPSTSGSFQITTVNLTSSKKRDVKRQLSGVLTLTLQNGILKDQANRIGYIASNYQFQFDAPVQAGARETSGWSLCGNQSLALGSSAVFYQCLSGTFYNLYSQSIRQDCIAINIQATRTGGATQITDGQPQASSPGRVSQITDGQPQATTPGRVTQISDGQPQATVPGRVTQIPDGQPQATAPGPKPAAVTQIPDGQPQASAPGPARPPPVSQISDGQPQASAPGSRTSVPVPNYTGAATSIAGNVGSLAAALLGFVVLL